MDGSGKIDLADERLGGLVGREIDHFRILSQLGAGGMGEVYHALDAELQRPVAIKIVAELFSRDAEFVARFEREARAASSLNHPNVAQVYSNGRWGGRPYYVMEYVEGLSLADLLDKQGRISGLKCLDYLAQACAGLRAAHEKGIVHRDIKPGNLMIDSKDQLKIVDFGLARRLADDSRLTQTDRVIGTPSYMSPEQATAESLDHRSDIYSLGASFYHLFAGEPPFEAATPIALMMKHVQEPLPPLRERNPRVPPGVCNVIEKMMAKRPEDRYQSYEELIEDIRLAQAGKVPAAVSRQTVPMTPLGAGIAVGAARVSSARPWIFATLITFMALIVVVVGYEWAKVEGERPKRENAVQPKATGSPEAPASGSKVSEPAGSPEGGSDRGDSPPRPDVSPTPRSEPPAPPQFDASVFFSYALRAKTLANLRRLSTAVAVYQSMRESLPASLEDLSSVDEIYPDELKDGWGQELLYARAGSSKFRLGSAGPDGRFGTDDDITMENGHLIQGDEGLPFVPERKTRVGRDRGPRRAGDQRPR